MARYGKKSKLVPAEVLKRATSFFGTGGVGLRETEKEECSITWEGGGGHVTVSAVACNDGSGTDVDVTSREWDHQAKEFLNKI